MPAEIFEWIVYIGERGNAVGYFDSPKNKALWEKELESLDAERKRRREEGYKPHQKAAAAQTPGQKTESGNPKVRRITLKMLEEIEKAAREQKKEPKATSGGISARRQTGQVSREPKAMEQNVPAVSM